MGNGTLCAHHSNSTELNAYCTDADVFCSNKQTSTQHLPNARQREPNQQINAHVTHQINIKSCHTYNTRAFLNNGQLYFVKILTEMGFPALPNGFVYAQHSTAQHTRAHTGFARISTCKKGNNTNKMCLFVHGNYNASCENGTQQI